MYYPNSVTEMPPYVQFQDVHHVVNTNVLKWWINSGQITIDQLSFEQRAKLKIVELFQQKILEHVPKTTQSTEPIDCTVGDVYDK